MDPLFEARQLAVRPTRRGAPIVQHVSFGLDVGQLAVVFSAPGGGMSTLVLGLAGLLPITGDVIAAGESLAACRGGARAAWRTRHIGLMLSQPMLVARRTAAENVELPLRLLRLDRRQRAAQVERALAFVRATAIAGERADRLGPVDARLVALARALATDPTVVLLDEPTKGLPTEARDGLAARLAQLPERLDAPVVWCTGDIEIAAMALDAPNAIALRLVDGLLTPEDPARLRRAADVLRVPPPVAPTAKSAPDPSVTVWRS